MTARNATTIAAARAMSILGHPLCVMPLAALLAAHASGADGARVLAFALGFLSIAAIVMLYSWRQVRAGRGQHVDASGRDERRGLNRFLLALLGMGAAIGLTMPKYAAAGIGSALAAGLIALAMATSRWLKLSLHAAFCVFAVSLLRPVGLWAMAIGVVFVLCVVWSRLILGRHEVRDVVIGIAAGALAGVAFWQILPLVVG